MLQFWSGLDRMHVARKREVCQTKKSFLKITQSHTQKIFGIKQSDKVELQKSVFHHRMPFTTECLFSI